MPGIQMSLFSAAAPQVEMHTFVPVFGFQITPQNAIAVFWECLCTGVSVMSFAYLILFNY